MHSRARERKERTRALLSLERESLGNILNDRGPLSLIPYRIQSPYKISSRLPVSLLSLSSDCTYIYNGSSGRDQPPPGAALIRLFFGDCRARCRGCLGRSARASFYERVRLDRRAKFSASFFLPLQLASAFISLARWLASQPSQQSRASLEPRHPRRRKRAAGCDVYSRPLGLKCC